MGVAGTSLCSASVLAAAGVLDWLSPAEIASSLIYLLPISVAAWGFGRLGAAITGVLSAAMWLVIDLSVRQGELSASLEIINMIVLTVAFQLFGQLLATLKDLLEHERKLARTDPLTSVHNRRAFWSAAAREVARGNRHGTAFSLAYIDVDGFKSVNDSFGHQAGDDLLRRIALALQKELRELDMVARLGGDEFALLLPGANEAAASRVIQRLQKALTKAAWRRSVDIDFSIGVLTVLTAPESVAQIVDRADSLMYQVKRSGRGMVLYDTLRAHVGAGASGLRKVGGSASRVAT